MKKLRNLAGKVAVHLPQKVVYPLTSSLVHRGADRPNKAEDKPQFHHDTQMFCVGDIYLQDD